MSQCQCILTNETQCQRTVSKKVNTRFCWQHQNCQQVTGGRNAPAPFSSQITKSPVKRISSTKRTTSPTRLITSVVPPQRGTYNRVNEMELHNINRLSGYNEYENNNDDEEIPERIERIENENDQKREIDINNFKRSHDLHYRHNRPQLSRRSHYVNMLENKNLADHTTNYELL